MSFQTRKTFVHLLTFLMKSENFLTLHRQKCNTAPMNVHQRLKRKRRNCWIKSLFFKYSRSFITLRLNHWCHMDCFKDVFTTFLGLECGSCIAVYRGSESSRIHFCVNYPFKRNDDGYEWIGMLSYSCINAKIVFYIKYFCYIKSIFDIYYLYKMFHCFY